MRPRLCLMILFFGFFYGNLVFGHDGNFSKMVKKITPSLVIVRSGPALHENHFDINSGTGIIISKNGYVLTNAHIVVHKIFLHPELPPQLTFKKLDKTEVLIPGRKYIKAIVVGVDPENDLALLKVDVPVSWLPLEAAELEKNDSTNVLGEAIIKVGFPGVVISKNPTFAHGYITNTRAFIGGYSTPYYVFDSSLSGGDSGGPALNSRGKIVAISTRTSNSGSVSFMVPSHIVNRVLPQLYNGDKKTGWLGINPVHCLSFESILQDDDLRDTTKKKLEDKNVSLPNLTEGIVIMSFGNQAIGDAKLLKIGDVILAINGNGFQDVPELIQYIAEQEPGWEIELIIIRDNKPMILKLKVGEYNWDFPGGALGFIPF